MRGGAWKMWELYQRNIERRHGDWIVRVGPTMLREMSPPRQPWGVTLRWRSS